MAFQGGLLSVSSHRHAGRTAIAADGEIVWSWHLDAGVKSTDIVFADDGEPDYSCAFYHHFEQARLRVPLGTRHSLRPVFEAGGNDKQNPGRNAPRIA